MSGSSIPNGGTSLTTLSALEPWAATLVLNLRLWCDGPMGQQEVWSDYRRAMPAPEARKRLGQFERLVRTLTGHARRPLVRHQVGCACVGSDECVFVHLIRTASEGELDDAALIATLLVGAELAEDIAWLARDVGATCRQCLLRTQRGPGQVTRATIH